MHRVQRVELDVSNGDFPYSGPAIHRQNRAGCPQAFRGAYLMMSQLRSAPQPAHPFAPDLYPVCRDCRAAAPLSMGARHLCFSRGDGRSGWLAGSPDGAENHAGAVSGSIADKLLLSTMFLVLSLTHLIRWPVTVLVFSRDIMILVVCTLLYATGTMKVFGQACSARPTLWRQIITGAICAYWRNHADLDRCPFRQTLGSIYDSGPDDHVRRPLLWCDWRLTFAIHRGKSARAIA